MHITFTEPFDLKVSGTDTKHFAAGWSGEVPDDIAAKAIKEKKASEDKFVEATKADAGGKSAKDDGKKS